MAQLYGSLHSFCQIIDKTFHVSEWAMAVASGKTFAELPSALGSIAVDSLLRSEQLHFDFADYWLHVSMRSLSDVLLLRERRGAFSRP